MHSEGALEEEEIQVLTVCILAAGGSGRTWHTRIVYVGVGRCVAHGRWGAFCFPSLCDTPLVFVSDSIVCMILYIYICSSESFNFILMILLQQHSYPLPYATCVVLMFKSIILVHEVSPKTKEPPCH